MISAESTSGGGGAAFLGEVPHPGAGRSLLVAAGILIATLVLFFPVRNHEFNSFGDPGYVTENPVILKGFTSEGVRMAFLEGHSKMWHPLTTLSHMLDVELFGVRAGAHLLVNVVLHGLTAGLLFILLSTVTRAFWLSALVACVFAWHPLRVESIAWVSERKDVLCALFWVLTLIAYVKYAQRPSRRRLVICIAVYAVAILTNPMMVMLPVCLLFLDFWPLGRLKFDSGSSVTPLVVEKVPLFALSLMLAMLAYQVQDDGEGIRHFGIWANTQQAIVSYATYLGKLVWPTSLAIFYPRPEAQPLWKVASCAVLLVFVTVLVWSQRVKQPYLVAGWCWYLAALLPVIVFVPSGEPAMADRYTYIPTLGLIWAMAWAVAGHFEKRALLEAGHLTTVVILGACLALTRVQLNHWRTPADLFTHTLKVTRNNAAAHFALGGIYYRQRDFQRAIDHVAEGLKIQPGDAGVRLLIGTGLMELRRYREAIPHCLEAVKLQPELLEGHSALAFAYWRSKQSEEALAAYQEVLRLDPVNVHAHLNMGIILAESGRSRQAIPYLIKATQIAPEYAETYDKLALAFMEIGAVREAINSYKTAIRLRPGWAQPISDLAWILATHSDGRLRDGAEALRLASRAIELEGQRAALPWGTKAAAYAELGRFEESVIAVDRGIALARESGDLGLVAELERHRTNYQARCPVRDLIQGP